jgi:hypothetical protein
MKVMKVMKAMKEEISCFHSSEAVERGSGFRSIKAPCLFWDRFLFVS